MANREDIEDIAKIAGLDAQPIFQSCARHGRDCVFVCASCGCGICLDCIKESGFNDPLLCTRCIQNKQLRELRFIFNIRSYLNPAFLWVAFCILLASVSFIFGLGRPNLKIYSSEHSVLPWFSWRDAKFLLSKASRQKRRAFFLRQASKNNEALKWAKSSADYFEKCSEIWKENIIYADLLFAAYSLRAEFKSDPNYLLQLKDLLTPESLQRLSPFIGYKIAQISGEDKERVASLSQILELKKNRSLFDFVLSHADKIAVEKIKIVCGTSPLSAEYTKALESLPKKTERQPLSPEEKGDDTGAKSDFEVEIKD